MKPTKFNYYIKFYSVYSEFQLDVSYVRKIEKTVVVCTWGAEHDGTIIKIADF